MKITFYGHASLGIEVSGKHILVDPYISANPQANHIGINALKADFILLTHAHGDHILDVEAIAKMQNRRRKMQSLPSDSLQLLPAILVLR